MGFCNNRARRPLERTINDNENGKCTGSTGWVRKIDGPGKCNRRPGVVPAKKGFLSFWCGVCVYVCLSSSSLMDSGAGHTSPRVHTYSEGWVIVSSPCHQSIEMYFASGWVCTLVVVSVWHCVFPRMAKWPREDCERVKSEREGRVCVMQCNPHSGLTANRMQFMVPSRNR